MPSTFTFKSEERAVKRREASHFVVALFTKNYLTFLFCYSNAFALSIPQFFQMLEQKEKLKETGKNQTHAKPQVDSNLELIL